MPGRFAKISKKLRDRIGKCLFCFTSESLEACHIFPRSWMVGRDPRFYAESNLIVLCRSCHRSFDLFVGVRKF